jgi:hypothetical protein
MASQPHQEWAWGLETAVAHLSEEVPDGMSNKRCLQYEPPASFFTDRYLGSWEEIKPAPLGPAVFDCGALIRVFNLKTRGDPSLYYGIDRDQSILGAKCPAVGSV